MNSENHSTDHQRGPQPTEPKVKELVSSCKSIILASTDENNLPTASYAPYVKIGGSFYILVSFMAKHAKNLQSGKPVSALFIEDEATSKQIFARHRLTLEVQTACIDRDSELWNQAIAELKQAYGKIAEVISEMKDFILIELKPLKGSYVNGFGSAYFVDENLDIMEHRNDVNHQMK